MRLPYYNKTAIIKWSHFAVLILSIMLVIFISYDTLAGTSYVDDSAYMRFQMAVCVIFMCDFFIGLLFAERKWHYIGHRWLFFIISMPYLNIIAAMHFDISSETMYFIRFMPLARGALALSVAIRYITTNRLTGLFYSYIIILLAIIYFASLIMLQYEQPVNPQIPDYRTALWWASMNATTIGSYINPVTAVGKVLAVILAAMGMILFPLFTVYITALIGRLKSRR